MTECRTPELQDLLPDYVSESLGDADRVRVVAHLATCDACVVDLDVLRRVRAVRPRGAPIDVARVVRALPAALSAAPSARPVLQLHTSAPAAVRSTRRRLWEGPTIWRLAASIAVVLTGGMSVLVARRGVTDDATTSAVVARIPDSAMASVAAASASVRAETTVAAATVTSRPGIERADVPVSYGGLDDVSDDELQRLLDRLEQWDGATNAEPLPSLSPVQTSTRGGALP